MYNLRYHIASLVAVFLALALGLVLGGLAVGGGMVDRQQQSLVKGLQEEFTQLRDDNRQLAGENEVLSAFSADVSSLWSAGRLAARTVVVVTEEGQDETVDAVRDAVRGAGGRVAVVTLAQPRLGLDLPSGSNVASLVAESSDPLQAIAGALAQEWRSSQTARPVTAALVEAGAIRLDGLPDNPGHTCLVCVAGEDGEADVSAVALMRAFAPLGPTLGAQTPGDDTGVAEAAFEAGGVGMDTLGNAVGDYTLVAALSEKLTGYYGTANGARDLYPTLSLP